MGSKGDVWEYDVLKMVTGQAPASLTVSTAITPYIALFTVTPADTGGGTECAAAGGYARVAGAGKFGTPTGSGATPSQVANSALISFPTATADWMAGRQHRRLRHLHGGDGGDPADVGGAHHRPPGAQRGYGAVRHRCPGSD